MFMVQFIRTCIQNSIIALGYNCKDWKMHNSPLSQLEHVNIRVYFKI